MDLHWQCNNSDEAIKTLVVRLARYKLSRIVVEATGGYERKRVYALAEKELRVVVVQPMQVRQYAKAQGILAKTDKMDARMLADFGSLIKPEVRQIQTKKIRCIRDLLARKRQLMEARTQELNRLQKVDKVLQATHTRRIKVLDKEVEWVNKHLSKEISEVTEWQQTYELLKSVPGIGDGVAHTLLGELPEVGSLTSRQVGALCGLAPYNRDSGQMKGKRSIKGSRAPIRTMLYMAMMSAIQHNSVIRNFSRNWSPKVSIKQVLRKAPG